MSAQLNRRQITLGTLLFIVLAIAGGLAGYRMGYERGYASGELKRRSERPFPKVHRVSDLVLPKDADPAAVPDYDSLIRVIEQMVAIDTWQDVGGPGVIEVMPVHQSIVVTQTPDVHEQIESLLRAVREANKESLNETHLDSL